MQCAAAVSCTSLSPYATVKFKHAALVPSGHLRFSKHSSSSFLFTSPGRISYPVRRKQTGWPWGSSNVNLRSGSEVFVVRDALGSSRPVARNFAEDLLLGLLFMGFDLLIRHFIVESNAVHDHHSHTHIRPINGVGEGNVLRMQQTINVQQPIDMQQTVNVQHTVSDMHKIVNMHQMVRIKPTAGNVQQMVSIKQTVGSMQQMVSIKQAAGSMQRMFSIKQTAASKQQMCNIVLNVDPCEYESVRIETSSNSILLQYDDELVVQQAMDVVGWPKNDGHISTQQLKQKRRKKRKQTKNCQLPENC